MDNWSLPLIRSFVIGSSILSVIHFFIRVHQIENKNYSYFHYSMIAPLYFGFMNALSLHLQRTYQLTDDQRYLLITAISVAFVFTLVNALDLYNFSAGDQTARVWYLFKLSLMHGFTYNVILRILNSLYPQ